MRISEAGLYDQFALARQEAVKLTGRFREAPSDSPDRDELWAQVVRQTETARSLLECFLDEHHSHDHRQLHHAESSRHAVHAIRTWS